MSSYFPDVLEAPDDVERAVRHASLPEVDFELAYGARILADTNEHCIMHEPARGQRAQVLAMTLLSLSRSGESSFRTVAFGYPTEESAAPVAAMGTSTLINLGVPSDATPRLTKASKFASERGLYHSLLAEGLRCPVGGIATVLFAEDDEIAYSHYFTSRKVTELATSPTASHALNAIHAIGKCIPGLRKQIQQTKEASESSGIDMKTLVQLEVLGKLTAQATIRPGGTVVVRQPLKVTL